MANGNSIKDKRIAVLAADGFEKVELTVPVKALEAAGAKVEIISLRRGSIRGVHLHEPAGRVRVTKTIAKANPADYDALLIPGGFINPDLLRQSATVRQFVRKFDDAKKPIATLCHGPWVLASTGLLKGRTMTSWPGIRDDIVNAGATWVDEKFVRDGNLATSRGPQDLVPFTRGIMKFFSESAPIPATMHNKRYQAAKSSPQRDEPPKVVLGAMKWMPKPSVRTALLMSALGLGIFAANRRRFAA